MDDRCSARGRQVAEPHAPWEGADCRSARPRRRHLSLRLARPTALLVSGLAGAVVALACSSPSPPPHAEPVTLTVGVPQTVEDDRTRNIGSLASYQTFQLLTASSADGRPTPVLVESWTVSQDGLAWTLRLRAGVTFSDGTPLRAAHVEQYFREAAGAAEGSAGSVCLADVVGVTTPSDREIVVRLSRPCSLLLDDLDYTASKPGPGTKPIGTGPFVETSSTADTITLTANEHYFDGKPAIDQVVIRSYETLREAWAEMLRGNVDFLWDVSPEAAEFLRAQSSVELRAHLGYVAYTIVFNSAREPFRRTEIRRALNLAVDREALLRQALRNQGRVAASPIWPNHWARPTERRPLAYQPAAAATALRMALGKAREPARGAGTPLLTFTCLVPEGFTVYERLALLVQQQLRTAGVEMRIEAPQSGAFNQRIFAGEFDAVLLPLLSGPRLSYQYQLWHSAPTRWNYWRYGSPQVDDALARIRDTVDPDGVSSAVALLDEALRADPPGIPLVWSQSLQAVSRRFVVPDSGRGRDALHVLWAWKPAGAGAGAP